MTMTPTTATSAAAAERPTDGDEIVVPPKNKRSKLSNIDDGDGDREKIITTAPTAPVPVRAEHVRRAWQHYRNFVDGDADDDDEEEEQEEEEEGGDVDELLELIEILASSSGEVAPSSSALASELLLDVDGLNVEPIELLPLTTAPPPPPRWHDVESGLVPMLLSMSYLHLASRAVSEAMFDPNVDPSPHASGNVSPNASASSSSPERYLPERYFHQSLLRWPTNPATQSLYANYLRMNSVSSVEEVCGMYERAATDARAWRARAVEFLRSEEDEENDEEDDEEEGQGGGGGGVDNVKEWVELLVLNGALDVDYVGDDEEEEEEGMDAKEGDAARDDGAKEGDKEEEEEYSCSQVESTASFMAAFLLSATSRHDEALVHLRKFPLSHRIHPNVWRKAQQRQSSSSRSTSGDRGSGEPTNGGKEGKEQAASREKGESRCDAGPAAFPPRAYRGAISEGGTGGGVLPPRLYDSLCALLAPGAPYWRESDYDRRGYYSYYANLDEGPRDRRRPTNVVEDVIVNHLLPLAERTLRDSAAAKASSTPPRIVGFEWWAHTRPLGANLGHQVHFDTDESLLKREGRVTHPLVSSVLYLTGAASAGGGGRDRVGDDAAIPGSTVVFDQNPGSEDVAPRAWTSRPRDNSFMVFPGDLLHGVLPCGGGGDGGKKRAPRDNRAGGREKEEEGERAQQHRLTFMVGFWTRDVAEGMGEREPYTPCGTFPPANAEHTWVAESRRGYDDDDGAASSSRREGERGKDARGERRTDGFACDKLPSASPAWERFEVGGDTANEGGPPLTIPKGLDHRFFVRDAPRCFSESLFDKEDCF